MKQVGYISTYVSNAFNQFVTIFIQLALIPIYINFWGSDKYGEWIVIQGFPLLLNLIEFGISNALADKMVRLYSKEKYSKLNNIAAIGFYYNLTITIVYIAALATLFKYFKITEIFEFKKLSMEYGGVEYIVILLVLNAGVSLLLGPATSVLIGVGSPALSFLLSGIRRLIEALVIILGLFVGLNILNIMFSLAIVQVMYVMIVYLYCKLRFEVNFFKINGIKEDVKDLFEISFGHSGINIGQFILLQGVIQVLHLITSSSIVVAFNMTRTITRLIFQMGMVANNSLRPIVNSKDFFNFYNYWSMFKYKILFTLMFGMFGYVFLSFFGQRIIYEWSHKQIIVDNMLLIILGISAVINPVWYMLLPYIFYIKRQMIFSSIFLISNLLSVLLLYYFGTSVGEPTMFAAILTIVPEFAGILMTAILIRKS